MNSKLSSKPPSNFNGMRPRSNQINEGFKSKLTRTLDAIEGGEIDRQSSGHRRNDSASGLRESTLKKMRNNSKLSRAHLIENIKGMNET